MSDLVSFFSERTPRMLEALRRLVSFESPSGSKEYVDRLGQYLAGVCKESGAEVTVYPRQQVGDLVFAAWNQDAPGKPILLVTHMDTVWPVDTLQTMPLREEGGLLYGPGTLDMKGGIVVALEAIRGLRERGELPNRPIWMFNNSDEETSSIHSRDLLREKAAKCGLVLVMEPAADGEALKTWRKGIGEWTIRAKGLASHAGQAPEKGINAVIEIAHQALYLHRLNDYQNGTSVSVTVIHGGIASNVIPPEASLEIDVRFTKASEAARVEAAIQAIGPNVPGAVVTVEGGIDRGPMERNEQMIRLFGQAKRLAESIGIDLIETGSGGASDGNFTAAMGIPTLDGLGPGGQGLHAAHEHVLISSLPRRAALLAKLLIDWQMDAD